MTVKAILERKGHDVMTLGPNEKLSEAIRILAEHKIGALVITNGDRKIVRHPVRARHRAGCRQGRWRGTRYRGAFGNDAEGEDLQ